MHAPVLFSSEVLEQLRSRWPLKYLAYCSEYLLMLSPGDEVGARVTQWKNELLLDLPRNCSLHSLPHFTIARFLLPAFYEDRLLRAFAAICASTAPRWLEVDGFGNFPNGNGRNVIFVKTPDIEFFVTAHTQIKRALRAESLQRCAQMSGKPHLTVAKDLSDASFAKWWTTFGRLECRGTFHADKLVLLRRPLGQRYNKCIELGTLPLLGATDECNATLKAKQSMLF